MRVTAATASWPQQQTISIEMARSLNAIRDLATARKSYLSQIKAQGGYWSEGVTVKCWRALESRKMMKKSRGAKK
jgi:hypothetical protein